MAVSHADVQAFAEFARERVDNGEVESMQALFRQWLEDREARELVRAIRDGEAEIEAGGGKPVDEAFADVRAKLGWPQ